MSSKYGKAFYSSVSDRAAAVASFLAEDFVAAMELESMTDVGCGSATWIEAFLGQGVKVAHGYDLREALDHVSPGQALDTRVVLHSVDFEHDEVELVASDVTVCLEVLEHLTRGSADALCEKIIESSNFVLFSAAQPGQGGTHHINERPLPYWLTKFSRGGFAVFDVVRPKLIRHGGFPRYYSLNMFALAKRDSSAYTVLNAHANPTSPAAPDDMRTRLEKIRFGLIRWIPVSVVTRLSKLLAY